MGQVVPPLSLGLLSGGPETLLGLFRRKGFLVAGHPCPLQVHVSVLLFAVLMKVTDFMTTTMGALVIGQKADRKPAS